MLSLQKSIRRNCIVVFKEYHVIQFTLQYVITKTEGCSAQTADCAVSFATEQYHSTNCLQSSLQLTTTITTLTHIAMYYCHN